MLDETRTQPAALRCLELFSGIGGFHYALKESGTRFEMLAAFDISDVANAIYKHNFPRTTVHQCNIQALTPEFYDRQGADLWTMSPPCQPFTRKGIQRDVDDRRCDALMKICSTLESMHEPPRFIFLENVCGFETSTAHSIFVEVLAKLHYYMQEFILSPMDLGIPNSRPRYYLLAKRQFDSSMIDATPGVILTRFPDCMISVNVQSIRCLGEYVHDECDHETQLMVNGRIAGRYAKAIDMVTRKSRRSSCFTKSYSVFIASSDGESED
uniref:DNA (cytosine-5-)-methyltransferase n=1 Tax=Parascaris univalens TaxID=6257 RepID=A0A915C4V7_PARUN